jgi:alkane 1-monooxygenase
MNSLKAYGFLLAYLTPLLLPFSWLMASESAWPAAWAYFPLFFLFVLLPLADHLIGRDHANPSEHEVPALEARWYYRALTLACLPIHLLLMCFALQYLSLDETSIAAQFGYTLSLGVIGGVMAINVAHELIHKVPRHEQFVGGVLLSLVCYGGFKIEHVRGHHVHVSTPLDASSATRGQSVYRFVLQSMRSNIRSAFALEAKRLRQLGLSPWSYRNELWLWHGLSVLWATLAYVGFGLTGLLAFLGQALVAALSLEIINYIEHYGLARQQLPDGRFERTTHLHSWNSNFRLTNWMLFQLQRHSDHHANARRRFQALRHFEDSPQLPSGYAAMFVLALIPPLWFRVMDKRVPEVRASNQVASM